MGNENAVCGNNILQLHGRPVTRALASALRASSKSSIESATTQNQGRVLRANSKRTALDEKKANAPKKRAILKDITNVTCENSYTSCFNVAVVNYTMLLLKLLVYMTRSMFLLTTVDSSFHLGGEYQAEKEGTSNFFQGGIFFCYFTSYRCKGRSCVKFRRRKFVWLHRHKLRHK